jgi:hypothetical protein
VLTVRPSTFRDQPGWLVAGQSRTGRKVRIFVLFKDTAEHIRTKLETGQAINALDYQRRDR